MYLQKSLGVLIFKWLGKRKPNANNNKKRKEEKTYKFIPSFCSVYM